MRSRFFAFAMLAFCLGARAEDSARISIPELLDPASRLRALQRFALSSKTDSFMPGSWTDLEAFSRSHRNLSVSELRGADEMLNYLVTWCDLIIGEGWRNENALSKPPSAASAVILPAEGLGYQIFSAEGVAQLAKTGYIRNAIIADLDSDGAPEIIEQKVVSMKPRDARVASKNDSADWQVEFLQVRKPMENSKASFAVLYNAHPVEQGAENAWGFQVRKSDEPDGVYVIELGPAVAPARAEAKVTFRWDKVKKEWIGPEPKNGDHYRVLKPGDPFGEAQRIAQSGGLGYPLAAAAEAREARQPRWELSSRVADTESLPPEDLSKPYRYESLKALSNEQIFDFMTEGRGTRDYIRNRMRESTSVPDFWTLDPRAAALTYVKRNRPPSIASRFLLSFIASDDKAPDEGDVTLSDGPSGCFSPAGAYVHHLHCAKEGSYLAFVARIEGGGFLPAENNQRFTFQKLELSYEQARHLFQTIWWMGCVRSRQLGRNNYQISGNGISTSDGPASVQIASGGRTVTVSGTRYSGEVNQFAGLGYVQEGYDPSAFVNLTLKLFQQEVPERLGMPWTAQEMWMGWNELLRSPEPRTPEELAMIKAKTAEFLRLFQEHKMAPIAVIQAIKAVGAMGWQDLGGDVEGVLHALPPLTEDGKRFVQFQEDLARWKRKLGKKASEEGFRERRIKPPVSEKKFAEFDAFYEAASRIHQAVSQPELDLIDLRAAADFVFRQIKDFDDAERLYQWALEDENVTAFVLARLVKLDRARAIELLKQREAGTEDKFLKDQFAWARQRIEPPKPAQPAAIIPPRRNDGPLSDKERAKALVTLHDPNSFEQWEALHVLVPPDDPKRYTDPAIGAALNELLTRNLGEGKSSPENLPLSAARHLGAAAWESLVAYSTSLQSTYKTPNLPLALPALTLIAQNEPTPYKAELSKLLAPELESTHGMLNATFWSSWQADLRDLKEKLESVATSGPEDYEGSLASGSSSETYDVKQRFHQARQIAALWNETDELARTRLLIAFAAAHAREFTSEKPGAAERLHKDLAILHSALSTGQRKSVEEFVQWCEANTLNRLKRVENAQEIQAVFQAARLRNAKEIKAVLQIVRSSLGMSPVAPIP